MCHLFSGNVLERIMCPLLCRVINEEDHFPLNSNIDFARDVQWSAFGANYSVSAIFIAFIAFGGLICSGKAPIIAPLKLVT